MFGYVKPDKGELKIKHYNLYRAFYCGVCKAIGRRYGNFPRLALNYDLTFFALMLSGLAGADEYSLSEGRCTVKGFKKCAYAEGIFVDLAADLNVVLAYCKFNDDVEDGYGLKSVIGRKTFQPAFRKTQSFLPQLAPRTDKMFARQLELEKLECWSADIAAEPFAEYMSYLADVASEEGKLCSHGFEQTQELRDVFNMLGRWIYTIDAADDFEEDMKNGNYNVFAYVDGGIASAEKALFLILNRLNNSFQELKFKDENIRAVCDNIVLAGLLRKTDEVVNRIRNIKGDSK